MDLEDSFSESDSEDNTSKTNAKILQGITALKHLPSTKEEWTRHIYNQILEEYLNEVRSCSLTSSCV
jgi:hypothetical protein